ncbi:MAG TPA: hypothetical protein VND15_03085 [Candidatus Acidoferrales bacterium]|nr:hypothetical protein [Candidatus Acidoferrales bacterium]
MKEVFLLAVLLMLVGRVRLRMLMLRVSMLIMCVLMTVFMGLGNA